MLLYLGVIITVSEPVRIFQTKHVHGNLTPDMFLEPYSGRGSYQCLYAPRSISKTKAKHLSSSTITYWCANNLISEDDTIQYSRDQHTKEKEPEPKDE
jgi:hypothetical protein